jgi:hypothetical protein
MPGSCFFIGGYSIGLFFSELDCTLVFLTASIPNHMNGIPQARTEKSVTTGTKLGMVQGLIEL